MTMDMCTNGYAGSWIKDNYGRYTSTLIFALQPNVCRWLLFPAWLPLWCLFSSSPMLATKVLLDLDPLKVPNPGVGYRNLLNPNLTCSLGCTCAPVIQVINTLWELSLRQSFTGRFKWRDVFVPTRCSLSGPKEVEKVWQWLIRFFLWSFISSLLFLKFGGWRMCCMLDHCAHYSSYIVMAVGSES